MAQLVSREFWRVFRGSPAILGVLLAQACTQANLSAPDTITTTISTPVASLNPLYATDANSQHINELTHASLVTISRQLVPEPYLAESFRFVNPRTIEFRLRRGCKFPDGEEVTSRHVEQSLAFFTDDKNQSPHSSALKRIQRFERVDDYTFRFILEQPTLSLVTDLPLLKIMQPKGIAAGEKPSDIPGAGPYRLTKLAPDDIILERWDQPCLPKPPMPKLRIKTVRDDLSRYLKLRKGEVDVVLNEMNYRKVEMILQTPGHPLGIVADDGIGYSYLGLNLTSEKLRDPRVREAVALSLDLPEIIRYKSRGFATQARNILADFNYYANLSVPIVKRDLSRARRLLDEAGYSNGMNGKPPLHLTLKTTTALPSVENARVIVAQAKEAGIEIRHQAFEWGIFFNDVKTGNTELYQLRWVGVTDPRIYFEVFHSGEIGKNNRTRYKNLELDKWIEKGEATVDAKERKAIYDQVQEIVARDLPYIGLWYGKNVAVFRKELKDVSLLPNGSWRSFLTMRK